MDTDWKAVARAYGLAIPEGDLERIEPVLKSLETSFEAALRELREEIEPALILSEPAVEGR